VPKTPKEPFATETAQPEFNFRKHRSNTLLLRTALAPAALASLNPERANNSTLCTKLNKLIDIKGRAEPATRTVVLKATLLSGEKEPE
jgi:hypothetical protein